MTHLLALNNGVLKSALVIRSPHQCDYLCLRLNSELLRFEQRICQIDQQPQTNDPADEVFPIHSISPQSLSQARTYQNDTPKKAKTNTIKMKSSIFSYPSQEIGTRLNLIPYP
jgi:hypothetical protein